MIGVSRGALVTSGAILFAAVIIASALLQAGGGSTRAPDLQTAASAPTDVPVQVSTAVDSALEELRRVIAAAGVLEFCEAQGAATIARASYDYSSIHREDCERAQTLLKGTVNPWAFTAPPAPLVAP